jgi:hypothetical protein
MQKKIKRLSLMNTDSTSCKKVRTTLETTSSTFKRFVVKDRPVLKDLKSTRGAPSTKFENNPTEVDISVAKENNGNSFNLLLLSIFFRHQYESSEVPGRRGADCKLF